MIPPPFLRWLASRPGPLGAYGSAYREWRWGDPHVRLLRRLCDPRRASVDVGAHAGSYAWFLRRYSARCIAFEPNPHFAAVMRRRFPAGVDVHNLALSDHPGTAVLRIPIRSAKPDPGRATIEAGNLLSGASGILEEIEVELVTLDRAIDEPVGFIKIDVEGHELKVLQGAVRILREDRPNMIVELEDRFSPGIVAATFAYLGQHGYHGWFRQPRGFLPIGEFVPELHQGDPERPEYAWNFVFSVDPAVGARLRL
jgi:FkbM family methyltransferase